MVTFAMSRNRFSLDEKILWISAYNDLPLTVYKRYKRAYAVFQKSKVKLRVIEGVGFENVHEAERKGL